MGWFSRDDIVSTKTGGFGFLLILSRGRILLWGSPALHYAGTDRLQMVGVGSLHVDTAQDVFSQLVTEQQTECPVLLLKGEAGQRKKNKDDRTP